jgi:flagellar basal-body rod modification protein FlgD
MTVTVNSVSATSTPATSQATKSTPTTGFGTNFNSFLTLLTTQLKNQDPMSPLDTNQFTQQLVSFSQVEQAINTNTKLDNLISLQSTSEAISSLPLVGKTVEYDGATAVLGDGGAKFSYTMPSGAASAVLSITDANGKTVWSGQGDATSGRHDVNWDGRDVNGSALPPGNYTLAVNAFAADKSPVTATITAYGPVSGIELQSGQPLMNVGGLRIPTTKMLSINDKI